MLGDSEMKEGTHRYIDRNVWLLSKGVDCSRRGMKKTENNEQMGGYWLESMVDFRDFRQ